MRCPGSTDMAGAHGGPCGPCPPSTVHPHFGKSPACQDLRHGCPRSQQSRRRLLSAVLAVPPSSLFSISVQHAERCFCAAFFHVLCEVSGGRCFVDIACAALRLCRPWCSACFRLPCAARFSCKARRCLRDEVSLEEMPRTRSSLALARELRARIWGLNGGLRSFC